MTETEGLAESIAKGGKSWRDVARETGAPEPPTPEEIDRKLKANARKRRKYYASREKDSGVRGGRALNAIGKLLEKPEPKA